MASKFSPLQNILQPKRLNSTDINRIQKGGQRSGIGNNGQTLTLNGVAIGIPTAVHSISTIVSNTPAKKGSNNMAKRNARERNRVKQVNLGFQSLRQHIPEGYRMKKMSKVDTLRCAVDYIRSMEHILEITPTSSMGEDLMRDSSYQSYSSSDMNQHLDKICSMEDALDHSFSSFSENGESPRHDCSSSSENLLSSSFQDSTRSQHHLSLSDQEQCEPGSNIVIVTSDSNTNPFQNLVASNEAPASILVPVQFHPHPLDENIDIVPSDENFNPPSSSFIGVVEIMHHQS
ncbi:unnamed protein product [Allacma fusca]|uniref:BHLH domain-containing protein n=1 Tax=Allacma fusca TaxID=39272 RepID=A0A8J2JF44_9HEXA|nr:unnamed protein product [Allacma fusca]